MLARLACAMLLAGTVFWSCTGKYPSTPALATAPLPSELFLNKGQRIGAGYAGSESCRDCHKADYNLWLKSNHALAERPIQPGMHQPAFGQARTFKHASQSTQIRTQDGKGQIFTLGFGSNVEPYLVERVIGHYPLRQYLTPVPGGRWQVHEASYDPALDEWFNVYGEEDRKPGEFGHWTGRGMNWNSMCAYCHNTRLRKNYDEASDSYRTTMVEMGVGCEACHGPLQAHVDWRNAHPETKQPDPTIKPFGIARTIGMCGSCHARRDILTGEFVPGDSFFDHYSLEILDEAQRWYPDGQIHDEDYEFNSFLSSKMYQRGIRCVDCHNAHSMKALVPGNDLCLRCHNGAYTNAPVIDPAEHGHHKLNDKGSECVGCHMPITVYMQRHPRHDHGLTIPDPLLTKTLNIPNACNKCHSTNTVDWALEYTDQWYGAKMNRHTRERAQWIAAASRGEDSAKGRLLAMLVSTNEPPYWRAVAANLLWQWAGEPDARTALLDRLKDEHPLVREKTLRSLEPLIAAGNSEITSAVRPLLDDPVRNVRVAAAWVMRTTLDPQNRAAREQETALRLDADQPVGQYRLAVLDLSRQHLSEALVHLRKAVEWDKYSPPFRCKLAEVLDKTGQIDEALTTLDQAEAFVPGDPHIPCTRATILMRNGRSKEARVAAARALEIQRDFQPAIELLRRLPAGQ